MPEKNHDLLQQGPHKSFGNDHVFYCSLPASKSWLGRCRKSQNDRLGWFCDTYCAVILWSLFCVTCSIPVTFCGAAVLKFKDQETLVSHYEVIEYVSLWKYKHLESLPDTNSQIFDEKQFAIHSFSLFGGIRLSLQTREMSELTASLSSERLNITEVRRQLNSVLTFLLANVLCPSIIFCKVLSL